MHRSHSIGQSGPDGSVPVLSPFSVLSLKSRVISLSNAGDVSSVCVHVVSTAILLFAWPLFGSSLAIIAILYCLKDAFAQLWRWLSPACFDF